MAGASPKKSADLFTQSWRLPLARFLLVLAMGLSGYLLYVSLRGGAVAGCGPDSGCDQVLKSRWAYWFGLPVSAPALLAYASLLAATQWLRKSAPARQRQVWRVMVALAVMIMGAAAWFIFLMIFIIKGLCPFCLVAHTGGIIIALLILRNAPIRPVPELPWQKEKQVYVPPGLALKFGLAGLAGIAVLVTGQVLHKKQMYVVKVLPNINKQPGLATNFLLTTTNQPFLTVTTAAPLMAKTSSLPISNRPPTATNLLSPPPIVAAAPSNPPPPPRPPLLLPSNLTATAVPPLANSGMGRVITTHGGLFQYDMGELPLIGSTNAPQVIVSLFDYTCHHCQIMHGQLLEVHKALSNQLAIVSLPVPLDAECNHMINRTHRTASNACNYARLGLAVWRADRLRFPQFDDWMFSRPLPPTIMEANTYAANLVGADKLVQALADKWIAERLQKNVTIYHTNFVLLQTGQMPQLIIGQRVSVGHLNSAPDLLKMLQEYLPKVN
jgi:uncharacterized membrane protein